MADLIINGRDALQAWGVRMGDNFLDTLGAPSPMKEFVENKSRLMNGKQVLYDNPRVDERDLTLTFTLEGDSPPDYLDKKALFYQELYKGETVIQVPGNGDDIYHLTYLGKSSSYAQSLDRTFGKIAVRFCEPDPGNRA